MQSRRHLFFRPLISYCYVPISFFYPPSNLIVFTHAPSYYYFIMLFLFPSQNDTIDVGPTTRPSQARPTMIHRDSYANRSFSAPILPCFNYSQVRQTSFLASLPLQAQVLPSIADVTAPTQCPCGACRKTCEMDEAGGSPHPSNVVDRPISIWSGFHGTFVGLVYLGVALLTTLLYTCQPYCR
jgi:hypothetical protein